MDMSCYLIVGLLLTILLSLRTNIFSFSLAITFWAIILIWSLGFHNLFILNKVPWVDSLGVSISYHTDGLSYIFGSLISGIGILVLVYSWFYTSNRAKLISLLNLFAISMLGIVIANDMIMLFLCWELTSVISYLLIQYDVNNSEANQAAFNSIFISVLGGLIMLVGFIYLHELSGTWQIIDSINKAKLIATESELTLLFWLLLFGAITKSAQFPFYFWLTGAMKAPTPVSAYLHSATMVNAGIFILARFHSLLSKLDIWYAVLSKIGIVTMFISSLLSVFQKDLKAILAYTTIFSLGIMVYLLGGNSFITIEAFTIFLFFHAIYKCGAFMLVGIIDKEYGTRDLLLLQGISRNRLFLSISLVIIFGAMAGLPPLFGFTVKEVIYEAKLSSGSISYLQMILGIMSSMLIATASFRCLYYLFKNNKNQHGILKIQKKLNLIYLCPVILSLIIILSNFAGDFLSSLLLTAIQAISGNLESEVVTPNQPLSFVLSLVTCVGGIVTFYLIKKSNFQLPNYFMVFEIKNIFENIFNKFLSFGKILTKYTQDLEFDNQLRIIFSSILIIFFIVINIPVEISFFKTTNILECVISFSLVVSALSLIITDKFLNNLISLGVLGFAVSIYFILNGAIDVSITQLLVEVLTIIVLLVSLRSLTIYRYSYSKAYKIINMVISLGFGALITVILFHVTDIPFNRGLQEYYYKNSYMLAHGKNIVNVILVDFRSLDTLGEGFVIIATSLGVITIIKKYFGKV